MEPADGMGATRWFPDARLNVAELVLGGSSSTERHSGVPTTT